MTSRQVRKVALLALGIAFWIVVAVLVAESDHKERAKWRAEDLRRTELCEARGGIPRYRVRGRDYDGCDFPR